jgi:predicted SAM-dependent methyltransferase
MPIETPVPEKIHYGCGQNVLAGWLNVDGFKDYYPWQLVSPDVQARILRVELVGPHPFPDGTFSFGYAEDFLEHLDQPESLIFLCEAYRTLKHDGVLRLSFPGLHGVLRRHYRSSDFEGANTGNLEAFTTWHHKHFYCAESLRLVVNHIGFRAMTIVTFGESLHPELRGLDTRPDQMDLNLMVEVTK